VIQNREKTNEIVITWFKLQGINYMILEALKERERENASYVSISTNQFILGVRKVTVICE